MPVAMERYGAGNQGGDYAGVARALGARAINVDEVAGNPDGCIARLREYIDAGARTIMLNSACPSDYVVDDERLLAESVLPALS